MKFFSVVALLALTLSAAAQDTAYTALNVVGKLKGQPYLDSLLHLEGRDGSSQPTTWRMIFEDSTSRGGLREIEVRSGQIISQRAPLKNPFSSNAIRVNLDRLQLDSDGAFAVAENEAIQQRLRFATANYLLQADSSTPVWRVQLFNSSGSIVQTLRIAADNGKIISGERTTSTSDNSADTAESPDDSVELKIHRTMVRTGRTIGNGFKHIGGSLQEIFTGERTIDKDLPGE